MLTKDSLKGMYTAIVTPFTSDSAKIDYSSLEKLIEFQIGEGADGLVVCGSTGEAMTLSEAEYSQVIKSTVDIVKGRVKVIAGSGSNSTLRAVELSKTCESCGVDGLLVVTPFYNKPPQAGIIEHYKQVKASTSLPIIAYNVPGRTGINLLPETVAKLTEQNLIIGIKEAYGSMDQILEIVALVGEKISLLSGEDSLVYSAMTAGGQGVISASANIAPEKFRRITDGILSGDLKGALRAQLDLIPLVKMAFMETNPIPIKTALHLMGIIDHPALRLPLVPAQEKTLAQIRKVLSL